MMLKLWRRIMVEKHQDTKFCELYILISHLCYWRQKQEINGFKSSCARGKSHFCHANATLHYQERGEVICAGGKGQDLPKLRAASCGGEGCSPALCADRRLVLVPSLLLLLGPLHWLLNLLLLLLAGSGRHRHLPGHSDHGALGRQDHHWCHVLHRGHFVAGELLRAVAGGASAVAGGALGAVAASVSTGAHCSFGVGIPGRRDLCC